MDEDRRKGMLCGLLAVGLRIEGLLRVAIERPETEDDIASQIREEFNLYSSIFEQAWGERVPAHAEENHAQPEVEPTQAPEECGVDAAAECGSDGNTGMDTVDDVAAEAVVEDGDAVALEENEEPAAACVHVHETHPLADTLKVDELIARKESADLRRAFTLNDKFRFRRTLFDGSDARFSEVLDAIEGMDTYRDAERYLAGVIDMDCEDSEDFMNIVNAHFGNKS